MDSRERIAWAAGLFEGEGSIVLRRNTTTGGVELRLLMNMTDQDVVERFGAVVGCGLVRPVKRCRSIPEHWKDQWRWTAVGLDAYELLQRLLPYLGNRRSERATEALAVYGERLENITRERVCPGCQEPFKPPLTKHVMKRIYCSKRCKQRVLKLRYV